MKTKIFILFAGLILLYATDCIIAQEETSLVPGERVRFTSTVFNLNTIIDPVATTGTDFLLLNKEDQTNSQENSEVPHGFELSIYGLWVKFFNADDNRLGLELVLGYRFKSGIAPELRTSVIGPEGDYDNSILMSLHLGLRYDLLLSPQIMLSPHISLGPDVFLESDTGGFLAGFDTGLRLSAIAERMIRFSVGASYARTGVSHSGVYGGGYAKVLGGIGVIF